MNDDSGPLDMTEEVVTKPDTLMRSLDQSRDIHQDDSLVSMLRHSQVRLDCSEGVGCDLRPSRSQRR